LHAVALDDIDDLDALVVQLLFDLLLVFPESVVELGVLWVLLDSGDGPDSGSLRADLVLEANGKQVSLFGSEVFVLSFDNSLEVLDHIVKSLGLLGNSGHENVFFQTHLS
jgi:hypothetical protein